MSIVTNLEQSRLNNNLLKNKALQKQVQSIHERLQNGNIAKGTGWVKYPKYYDKKEFKLVKSLASQIISNSQVLLVLGIGGSFLGASAGIQLLGNKSGVEVIFLGTNFSSNEIIRVLDYCKNKDITVNVISKSGGTTETAICLHLVEEFLKNKYKKNYKERLIVTTDKEKGALREKATKEKLVTLTVPDNIGGRFSVLSSVGLLPFAVAGLSIDKIMAGAFEAMTELSTADLTKNSAYKYAVARYLLHTKKKKSVETLVSFLPELKGLGAWWQQLFAESEGKDGKGIFVSSLTFSTDLHSVGQYIQEGSPIILETFLHVKKLAKNISIKNLPKDSPIKYLEGKTLNEVNEAAYLGTVLAHTNAKVPVIKLEIEEISEKTFGYLIYFFELACGMSAYLLKVNPFNQPGVEAYKQNMRDILSAK